MAYTLSKELEQELIVSAPELQPSYAAIVEYLEAINQKEASGSNSQELQNQLAIQLGRLEDLVKRSHRLLKDYRNICPAHALHLRAAQLV